MAKASGGARGRAAGGYKGGNVRWDANNTHDGEYMPNGDIYIGPKFFAHDEETKRDILSHEMGHGTADRTGVTGPAEFWATGAAVEIRKGLYFGGNRSIEEGAAEALNARALSPVEMRARWPKIYKWATGVYKRAGISPEAVRIQATGLAKRLNTPGPAGGRMTLEELNG